MNDNITREEFLKSKEKLEKYADEKMRNISTCWVLTGGLGKTFVVEDHELALELADIKNFNVYESKLIKK